MDSDTWQTYEEPEGYFRLRCPPDWEIHRSTMRRRIYPVTSPGQYGTFGSAAPQFPNGIDVSAGPRPLDIYNLLVSVRCLTDALEWWPEVFKVPTTNDALGGAPAFHTGSVWTLAVPPAYFEVRYAPAPDMPTLKHDFEHIPFPSSERLAVVREIAEGVIRTFTVGPTVSPE